MKLVHGTILFLFIGSVAILWFFPIVIESSLNKKPALYLIPEQKKSAHLTDSFPKHNQFLAAQPTHVNLSFNQTLSKHNASILYKGKQMNSESHTDETNKTLLIPLKGASENGIYLVKYSVCFSGGDCDEGQFAYHVDITKMTNFSNFTNQATVTIKVSAKSVEHKNIVVDEGTQISWMHEGGEEFSIQGNTFELAAEKTETSDVLGASSIAETFTSPGEYSYTLSTDPTFIGRILVLKKEHQ